MVPSYPDGRRPRPRTVIRRMTAVLEIVSRGPNGSLGRGSVWRVIPNREVGPDDIPSDDEWLLASAERMTKVR